MGLDTLIMGLVDRLLGRDAAAQPLGPPKLVSEERAGSAGSSKRRRRISGYYAGPLTRLLAYLIDSFIADPRAAIFTHTCGGAVADHGETDTAFPHRNAETMLVFFTGWMDPEQDEEGKQLCRDWHDALAKHSLGYYDNIEQEGDTRVARNFGPNYQRLREIKAAYDPGNQFRLNSNIEPA